MGQNASELCEEITVLVPQIGRIANYEERLKQKMLEVPLYLKAKKEGESQTNFLLQIKSTDSYRRGITFAVFLLRQQRGY